MHGKKLAEMATIDDFLDYIIFLANTKVDHNIQDFMATVHRKILASMNNEDVKVNDNVLKAYFRMYALLRGNVISRSRIITTAQGVVEWIKN